MKLSGNTILMPVLLLPVLLLAGCSSNVNRAFYEGIKSQNEVNKTPSERAMTPTPIRYLSKRTRASAAD
ncbi:MAG TPA: hypothetical protein VMV48_00810 [Gallionellaceae bacterium]|nr:hypothetical protein [Gallionellaceae bacterium]